MGEWAKISLDKYRELNAAAKRVNATPEAGGEWERQREVRAVPRYAKVTKCTLGTGFGEIQFCTGNRDSLVADTSVTVKCGMSRLCRVDDLVIVDAIAANDYAWEVVAIVGLWVLYKDPATDGSTLASVQDNPAVAAYCTDSVVVP